MPIKLKWSDSALSSKQCYMRDMKCRANAGILHFCLRLQSSYNILGALYSVFVTKGLDMCCLCLHCCTLSYLDTQILLCYLTTGNFPPWSNELAANPVTSSRSHFSGNPAQYIFLTFMSLNLLPRSTFAVKCYSKLDI